MKSRIIAMFGLLFALCVGEVQAYSACSHNQSRPPCASQYGNYGNYGNQRSPYQSYGNYGNYGRSSIYGINNGYSNYSGYRSSSNYGSYGGYNYGNRSCGTSYGYHPQIRPPVAGCNQSRGWAYPSTCSTYRPPVRHVPVCASVRPVPVVAYAPRPVVAPCVVATPRCAPHSSPRGYAGSWGAAPTVHVSVNLGGSGRRPSYAW